MRVDFLGVSGDGFEVFVFFRGINAFQWFSSWFFCFVCLFPFGRSHCSYAGARE